jgi:COP9 signalosome complex subunit 6
VHKAGSLDLVGWFSNEPLTELRPAHVDIHHQILSLTDTALLLTVDPDLFGSASSQTGDDELPVSVYEGVRGAGGAAAAAAGPTAESSATSATTNANDDSGERMDVDIPAPDSDLRFKKLPYSIESGEAEMIAVSHVAKGGATRAAPAAAASASAASAADAAPKTPKGKERARDERGGHAGEQADAAATAATQRASKDPAAVDDGDDYDAEDFNEEYLTDEEREGAFYPFCRIPQGLMLFSALLEGGGVGSKHPLPLFPLFHEKGPAMDVDKTSFLNQSLRR